MYAKANTKNIQKSDNNKMVRIDKEEYNQKVLNSFKGNPKKFYGHMRNLKTTKAPVTQSTRKDGIPTADGQQVAELLSEFFRRCSQRE
jgi:hypothetical protein